MAPHDIRAQPASDQGVIWVGTSDASCAKNDNNLADVGDGKRTARIAADSHSKFPQ